MVILFDTQTAMAYGTGLMKTVVFAKAFTL